MTNWINILLVIQVVTSILLITVILIQKSSSDGLSGLSGGGGGGGLVTARAAANFFTKATVVLATIFMLNALALANLSTKTKSNANDTLEKALISSDAVPMAK